MSGHVGPFSFPSSVLATNIVRHDRIILPPSLPANAFWSSMLPIERDYPVPSLLLAIIQFITNIPFDLLPFLPISEFTIFVFYYTIMFEVLYRKDLFRSPWKHLTILLLIVYDLFNRINAYYVGRATLGVAFFIVSVFLILKLTISNKKNPWIILIMVILVATSYTYYTSTLAISSILLLFSIAYTARFMFFDQHTKGAILSLAVVSLFLLLNQPILNSLVISPNKFIDNFIAWILAQLKIEKNTEAFYLSVGDVPLDLFTRISVVWIGFLLRILFILTLGAYLLDKLWNTKKLNINDPFNTLVIIVIGASLAELFYTFQTPIFSLRFATMLSVLYFPLTIARIKRARIKIIINITISILLIIFYVGSINGTILYGNVNSPRNLYGFNSFISGITQPYHSVIIAGDSYYTGYASFKAFLNDAENCLHFTTLGKYTVYLFSSHGNFTIITEEFTNRGINYLMLVNDGKPISGDPWGYTIMPSHTTISLLLHRLGTIYNDGHVYLLSIGDFK
jgi:hypothetical protein